MLIQFWKNLSIVKKLYIVIGTMALLIACELATLKFSMGILSAVRAFVGGEGLWSKAQKNAAFSLQRFAVTHDQADFQAFLDYLKVPEGDHKARMELGQPHPRLEIVREGFLSGDIHRDDVEPMIKLLHRFSWEQHLARAIEIWGDGDQLLAKFKQAGIEYHDLLILKPHAPAEKIAGKLTELRSLNDQMTRLENEFSSVLGEGSRWLEKVIMTFLFFAVLIVESIGLTLTIFTSRSIAKNLAEINSAAQKIGRGDLGHKIIPKSGDEIGTLAESLENMRLLLEKSYSDLEKRVQERTAALEHFTIFASHDLKEPLRTISVWLDILAKDLGPKLSPEHREFMDFVIDASQRMRTLIDALLNYGQVGKQPVSLGEIDCQEEIQKVVEMFGIEIHRLKADIIIEQLPKIMGDSVLLTQVFQNLVSNALKYRGDRPPKIHIRVQEKFEKLIFSVEDNGIGFAHKDAERIFNVFERLQTKEDTKGSGIGLALCRKIVELHGGEMWAESTEGQGSTFYFSIPKSNRFQTEIFSKRKERLQA